MAANDNVVTCSNSTAELLELFAAAIGVDAGGKKYLRLYAATNVADSKAFSCGDPVGPEQIMNELRNCFALDANGDVCIRTGTA